MQLEITVAGGRLEALVLDGDPGRSALVLLHEGLGSVGLWRDFPGALAAATGRRVLAFSRFGHGRSDPPPRPRTRTFFGEEALDVLPEVLARLDAAEPILVGHSDGASIALVHAGHRPVSGAVLMSPHVIVEDVTLAGIRRARDAFAAGGLRERLARHHDDPDAAFHGWCDVWLHEGFGDWSLEADADAVRAPVLLVQGEQDEFGTLDQLARIEARVRGPVRRLVTPGGHTPHLEHPELVIAEIAAFVSDLP